MPSPSIGSVAAFTITWKKQPSFARSKVFRQPNANGNNHSVGSSYSEPSQLTSEHYITDQASEKAFLKSCAALCGAAQTVTEVTNGGASITHDDVFIETFRVTKSNAAAGLPGGAEYVVIIEWTVYLPEDW